MAAAPRWKMQPVALSKCRMQAGFWGRLIAVNHSATLPAEYEQLRKSGRIESLKCNWKPGRPHRPHVFWPSDVAKWLEAACYGLTTRPDAALKRRVNHLVRLFERAQQPDGYLNPYFTVVEPEKRWTNLRDHHELYCACHLFEAAVAHHEATGERRLLDVACRLADHIDSLFGRARGKKRGYPGHEEIELALVRLYRATGKKRYLKLSSYFIDERGRRPHYFDAEARARGEDPARFRAGGYDYCQAHQPVREQTTAEGHAVRAMYLYSAMADVGAETGDSTLINACRRLWKNVTERRMYVTGGIGSTAAGERFTCDCDLPNETAYAETCAAIGLVFWAHRMLQITGYGTYADVMERALYNGVLSGVSLDGTRFFYTNPLAVHPASVRYQSPHTLTQRAPWFGCACCPPNLARLVASLPRYAYSSGARTAWAHIYGSSEAELDLSGRTIRLSQRTDYPWNGSVSIRVFTGGSARFTLALRIPGWCPQPMLKVNGRPVKLSGMMRRGYAHIRRLWHDGDRVELELPMPVERVYAHPRVRSCAGRLALQRGPIVYCLEQADNGPDLNAIAIPPHAKLRAQREPGLLGGVVTVSGKAMRATNAGGSLYGTRRARAKSVAFKAVPYYAWANRGPGEMLVWVREA